MNKTFKMCPGNVLVYLNMMTTFNQLLLKKILLTYFLILKYKSEISKDTMNKYSQEVQAHSYMNLFNEILKEQTYKNKIQ